MLGELRVDGKSNEVPAVPELLALLAVEGCIVTADAMHAQKATAQAILDRGGDYVLALKANRPALFEDVRLLLEAPPNEVASTTDGDHGRIETRRAAIIRARLAPRADHGGRPGAARLARRKPRLSRPEGDRQGDRDTRAGRPGHHRDPLLPALPAAHRRAAPRGRAPHWQIENCLHWVLDVVLDEDQARARKGSRARKPRGPGARGRQEAMMVPTLACRRRIRARWRTTAWHLGGLTSPRGSSAMLSDNSGVAG